MWINRVWACWWKSKCHYKKNPFSSQKTDGIVKRMVMLGFMMKSLRLKIYAHLKRRSVFVVLFETAGALRWLLLSILNAIRWRKWLGTHGGNISAQHGRKCTPIICRFIFFSGDEILYIVNEDKSQKLHCRDVLGIPAPILELELQHTASQRTTH